MHHQDVEHLQASASGAFDFGGGDRGWLFCSLWSEPSSPSGHHTLPVGVPAVLGIP